MSFDNVPLEKKEDYKPAEQKILEAINNVYSAPFDVNEMQRLATQKLGSGHNFKNVKRCFLTAPINGSAQ